MTGRAAQRAFGGLLARPLVTAASDPELYRTVASHTAEVRGAARTLGYRLAASGQAFRLVRVPVAGTVTAPPPPPDRPGRRTLALTCVLAAACAEVAGPASLGRLSGRVRDLTTGSTATVSPYDPELLAHRRQLAAAAALLEHWGVLRPVRPSRPDEPAGWVTTGAGAGPEYDVDPAALELLTSPDVLTAALSPALAPPADDSVSEDARAGASRPVRALRALVETPAVLYAELSEGDAGSLRATRGLRSSEAASLTGGQVEARTEGLILIINDEPRSPVTSDWPGDRPAGWVSLALAGAAGQAGQRQSDGTVTLTSGQVDEQASLLHGRRQDDLAGSLRDDPAAVRATAEQQLVPLGLVRIGPDGGWALSPVAGRYRPTDGQS
ncbi:MAG TPA: DUF2398 family protein [Streptosporangiaceae bacterium]|jgi:uncharacterized protein (TIGR02678 family)